MEEFKEAYKKEMELEIEKQVNAKVEAIKKELMANSKREITGISSKKQTFTAQPVTKNTELNADLNLNSSFVSRSSNTSKTRAD